MTHPLHIAALAYLTYGDWLNWKTPNGTTIPQWEHLTPTEQLAWIAATTTTQRITNTPQEPPP